MEFGRVDDLEDADLSLPPDHPQTAEVLKKAGKPVEKPIARVGCAKWGRKEWVGYFYPKGTKEKDFLEHYARHFNSIELNAIFHRLPPPENIQKWLGMVGDDFEFCPKFFQGITHWKRLKNAESATEEYLAVIRQFGKHLGPCFLQLPPNFKPKNGQAVMEYLDTLPGDIKVFIEFRDPDWFKGGAEAEEVFSYLQEKKFGTVISDGAGRRDAVHQRLTTPEAFIRFVGNDLHPSDYTRMDDWIARIKTWLDQGLRELNFFMHQHEELESPKLAAYFIEKLNKECGTGLKVPEMREG